MSEHNGIQEKIGDGLESQMKGEKGGLLVFGIAALAVVAWAAIKITEIVAPLLMNKDTDSDSNVYSDVIYDDSSRDDVNYSDNDETSDEFSSSSN